MKPGPLRLIRDMVVRTSSQMSGFYKFLYHGGVKVIVLALRQNPSVLAIYLTGGLAKEECTPGFSDIDLMVIFRGGEREREKIDQLMWWLAKVIPPLVYPERSIFSEDELKADFQQDLFLQYKFSGNSQVSRLLFGGDVLADFRSGSVEEVMGTIAGQAMYLWAQVIKLIFFGVDAEDPKKHHYLLGKLVTDCHRLNTKDISKAFLIRDLSMEAAYAVCYQELREVLSPLRPTIEPLARSIPSYTLNRQAPHFIISSGNQAHLERFKKFADSEGQEEIASIHLCPFQLLGIEEENLCVYIVLKGPLSLKGAHKINRLLRSKDSAQKLHPFILTDGAVFSLSWKDNKNLFTALMTPRARPEIYLYLSTPQSVIWGVPFHYPNLESLNHELESRVTQWLDRSEKKVCQLLRQEALVRLPNLDFQTFFWQALQIKLLKLEPLQDQTSIPISSFQIYSQMTKPGEWLDQFYKEFQNDLAGESSRSEAYFTTALEFLREAYEIQPESKNFGGYRNL